jgi:putative transposase
VVVGMARTKPWTVSDEFWEKVEPLIPPAPSRAKGGRTRMDDRKAFAAMIYVLRTGIQWNALPREMGASSTVHDRYQEWERLGFFEELWRAGLLEYDELQGIEWEWQALDGAMTKAPLGRGATAKNPTDRAKKMGTKRSMLTDGVGIPLAVAVEGANRHDSKLLVATLEGIVVARPAPGEEEEVGSEQHLCLEAAYDSELVRQELEARSYQPHISPADKKKRSERKEARQQHLDGRARRWVVERTHSWLNRSRRLLVRWEKKTENYLAFIHLACAQLIFSKLLVSG